MRLIGWHQDTKNRSLQVLTVAVSVLCVVSRSLIRISRISPAMSAPKVGSR